MSNEEKELYLFFISTGACMTIFCIFKVIEMIYHYFFPTEEMKRLKQMDLQLIERMKKNEADDKRNRKPRI